MIFRDARPEELAKAVDNKHKDIKQMDKYKPEF
jgi:hypothetical protein